MRRALRAVRRRYNWPRLTPPLLMYSVFQDDIARPQSFLEAIVRHSGASGMGSEACTGNGVSLSLSLSLSFSAVVSVFQVVLHHEQHNSVARSGECA